MHERLEQAVRIWNEVAKRSGVPACRVPHRRIPGLKALLREESDFDVIRRAMELFAGRLFNREQRYGLSNFLKNRLSYLDMALDEAERRVDRDVGVPQSIEQMAEAAGLTVEQYKEYHRISS